MALTTLAKSLRVSKSSNMFEAFVVISSMYNFSKGWYTYLTLSVSTNVCCLPVFISLGKAARRPSIRDRVISTNCRESGNYSCNENRNRCSHIKHNFTWISLQWLYSVVFKLLDRVAILLNIPFPALLHTAAARSTWNKNKICCHQNSVQNERFLPSTWNIRNK